MKGIVFKIVVILALIISLAGVINYFWYGFYPASRPTLYATSGVSLIAYTTVSGQYIVLLPTMNEMSRFSNNVPTIVIAGYTAPLQTYSVAGIYNVTVAILPTIVTLANVATFGSYTLTRVVNDPIPLIEQSRERARESIYFFIVAIILLFSIPMISKAFEWWEEYKVKREKELEEMKKKSSSEDEEEKTEEELEKLVVEKYLVDKTAIIRRRH